MLSYIERIPSFYNSSSRPQVVHSMLCGTNIHTPRIPSSRLVSPTYRGSEASPRVQGHLRQCDPDKQVHLSPHQQCDLVAQINTTVLSVVRSMVGERPSRVYWRPKGVKNDIAYYIDDNVNPGQRRFCCVSETNASAEEIIQLFLATDTQTLLKHSRIVYNNILDTRVLSVLEPPTSQHPFKSVYVRYSSYEAPQPFDNRDLCLVVATDVFLHEDGSIVGYCLWDSVDIPDIPEYHETRGLVRSRMFRSGFFCRTAPSDDPNSNHEKTTKIVYLVGMEPGGATAPGLAAWLWMERFGGVLTRLCSYFRRKQLNPATFRPRCEWPSARRAKQCRGCAKPFHSSFTYRRHCAACGEVFCKACHSKEAVDLPGVGIVSLLFCSHCLGSRGIETAKAREYWM